MQKRRYECPCPECAKRGGSETAEWHRALNEAILHAPENNRRLVAGVAAMRIGRGGISQVARITGLDRKTITRGIRELKEGRAPLGRIRKAGGGRKRVEKKRRRDHPGPEKGDEG